MFVDNVADSCDPVLLRISLSRELAFSDIVYHERGHHIHKVIHPEFREREDVADYWRDQLWNTYLRRAYWFLIPVVYPLGILYRLTKKIARFLKTR